MQNGSTLILLVAYDGQRPVTSLVHRGSPTDIAFAVDRDVCIGIYYDSRFGCGFRQGDVLVVEWIDEPFALA